MSRVNQTGTPILSLVSNKPFKTGNNSNCCDIYTYTGTVYPNLKPPAPSLTSSLVTFSPLPPFALIISPYFFYYCPSPLTLLNLSFTINAVVTLIYRLCQCKNLSRCSVNTAKIDVEMKIETAATILENQATEHLKAFVITYTHSYAHIIQESGTFTFSAT